mmetsp:Transcript_21423/g.32523  ORF Transcript_21423/g.32523 Transcript_21423/m.32523 type:complete len:216 (-) Transcript_21423:702-1349(-)
MEWAYTNYVHQSKTAGLWYKPVRDLQKRSDILTAFHKISVIHHPRRPVNLCNLSPHLPVALSRQTRHIQQIISILHGSLLRRLIPTILIPLVLPNLFVHFQHFREGILVLRGSEPRHVRDIHEVLAGQSQRRQGHAQRHPRGVPTLLLPLRQRREQFGVEGEGAAEPAEFSVGRLRGDEGRFLVALRQVLIGHGLVQVGEGTDAEQHVLVQSVPQ